MRTVYVNGEFVPESEATVSVFDRGFLMGDSVYEVVAVIRGCLLEFEAHAARLGRSLDELSIPYPVERQDLRNILRRVVVENRLEEGIVYVQITRGIAERDFIFPSDPRPGIVVFTQAKQLLQSAKALKGLRIMTVPDIRWERCDIKTTQLLAACMAKAEARRAGADDAWFVRGGMIMEGTSSNAFIVNGDGTLITRCLTNQILHGITRKAVAQLARQTGMRVEERPFSQEEACHAREAFITSASTFVWPVIDINGIPVGTGKLGPITENLRRIYLKQVFEEIGMSC